MNYNAFFADDEPRARESLRRMIMRHPRLSLCGEASSGTLALAEIDRLAPDLVFLDIAMPGLTGLQLVERMSVNPYIIFTTAYADHAVKAFELQAVDYLLKPFGPRRFNSAVERVLERLDSGNRREDLEERLSNALVQTKAVSALYAQQRGIIHPIPVSEITRIEACDDYVRVLTPEGEHLVNSTMQYLSDVLLPSGFVRIHRSTLVPIGLVRTIEPSGDGRARLTMRDGTRVQASRTGLRRLKEALSAS